MVVPGLASSNAATVLSQYALPSPVVELCQNVISLEPSSLPEPPPEPPEQPAARRVTLAPSATASAAPLFFLIIVESLVVVDGWQLPVGEDSRKHRRVMSNVFDNGVVTMARRHPHR
ncbi:hypothetical protein Cma02nite_02400 [Cellulomonas marina]|nr:hypothetical protein Cma02nite_02400 [Cellulomonas marina]